MYRILATVCVLIVTGAGVVFAQAPDQTNQYDGDAFSLLYPNGWTINEEENLVQIQLNEYRLNIHTDEILVSLPAGDFERRKLVGEYGIPVDVLIYEAQVKQVLYGRLETPEISLTILLDVLADQEIPYEAIAIPHHVIEQANWMVSTIEFLEVEQDDVTTTPFFTGEDNPIDSWLHYTHPTEPFAFRYADTWTLQETENRIILSRDEVQFVIAYTASDDPQPSIDPELLARSNVGVRPAVYGLFQSIPSQAVEPTEAGALGITYTPVSTSDNHFAFWVKHSSTGTVDWEIGDEVDRIINTFQVRP